MCGIVGYSGYRDCSDVLVDALSRLEYRGYDSAGIAVFEKGKIEVAKCKGRLKDLVAKMEVDGKPQGNVGMVTPVGQHTVSQMIQIRIPT